MLCVDFADLRLLCLVCIPRGFGVPVVLTYHSSLGFDACCLFRILFNSLLFCVWILFILFTLDFGLVRLLLVYFLHDWIA